MSQNVIWELNDQKPSNWANSCKSKETWMNVYFVRFSIFLDPGTTLKHPNWLIIERKRQLSSFAATRRTGFADEITGRGR